jgi:hypothetical protein
MSSGDLTAASIGYLVGDNYLGRRVASRRNAR